VHRGEDDPPDVFADAITAIAGKALLERAAEPEVAAGVENALAYLLASVEKTRRAEVQPFYMDYTVWSHSWMLWFMADCLEAGVGEKGELKPVMKYLVEDLVSKQKDGGGWSYYVTGDISGEVEAANQSISFVSAAVVLALQRAEKAGVRTPEKAMRRAVSCLEDMRDENGAFQYMRFFGSGPAEGTGVPGAAGRGPVCELALLGAGRSDAKRIQGALDLFMEHRADFVRQLGKALMHAGPDGQGCHYLMFDYALSATALGELPEDERAPYRTILLELILDARSVEGGFRDTSINGWAYGTAMALLAFRALEPLP
jgi:hypothetical protein